MSQPQQFQKYGMRILPQIRPTCDSPIEPLPTKIKRKKNTNFPNKTWHTLFSM